MTICTLTQRTDVYRVRGFCYFGFNFAQEDPGSSRGEYERNQWCFTMSTLRSNIVRNKTVNNATRVAVIQLFRARVKSKEISQLTGVSLRTVQRICSTWVFEGRLATNKPGGSKKKFTPRMYRHLSFLIARDRKQTKAEIFARFREIYGKISDSTIKRALRKLQLFRKPCRKRQILSAKHRRARLAWTRNRRGLNMDYWQKVIFSDECKVKIGEDGRIWVWSRSGEGYRPDLYGEEPKSPKLSVMIWGCISYNGVGTIYLTQDNINAAHYRQIIDDKLWPVISKEFPAGNCVFQQDNCSIHTAHLIKDYFKNEGISLLPWPAKSPDLNIIENLWFILKQKIKRNIVHIRTLSDLEYVIIKCWREISLVYVRNLYKSIPRRLRSVQINKGHLTRY